MTHGTELRELDGDDPRGVSRTTPADDPAEDGEELKLTVRRLELPVRPRGVLAE